MGADTLPMAYDLTFDHRTGRFATVCRGCGVSLGPFSTAGMAWSAAGDHRCGQPDYLYL